MSGIGAPTPGKTGETAVAVTCRPPLYRADRDIRHRRRFGQGGTVLDMGAQRLEPGRYLATSRSASEKSARLSERGSVCGRLGMGLSLRGKAGLITSQKDSTTKIAMGAPLTYNLAMKNARIGYARCSTDKQDLTAQREALIGLGVDPERVYTDHGLTGRNRDRPGLDQALAAVREGDTLVVAKLDRLARSVPDAREIATRLQARGVKLALGGAVYDPSDPMGKMFFNILATFAEFESDLIRMRTREGMAVARAKGKLRGKKPKLSDRQSRELRRMYDTGDYSISDLSEVFSVSRPTVYRTLQRHQAAT